MYAIFTKDLKKSFSVSSPIEGSWTQKIKNYFFPRKKVLFAVDGLNLAIKKGERVAFIGPNGAGKSTTIKLLTGIVCPSEGTVEILGQNPHKARKSLAFIISAIFGHTSKLWHHLPIGESYRLLAAIYDISEADFQKRLNDLSHKFGVVSLLHKSARQLSLGEKMRCEIVASLLHKPQILFLDEPTIGLDMVAKTTIRELLRSLSEKEGMTLLLTSHDTDDVESVCDRVLVIDHGRLVLDDTIMHLKTNFMRKKTLHLISEEENLSFAHRGVRILENLPYQLKIEIDLGATSLKEVVDLLVEKFTIKDLTIENPSLESILRTIYAK
ncbi:MAG: ATP-binding cassette domain-containing protein [Verrucomicrobia bacterium]|nr:ATP-binding cassette domain-containing protein [Verrucomicrobiota bacterium]